MGDQVESVGFGWSSVLNEVAFEENEEYAVN